MGILKRRRSPWEREYLEVWRQEQWFLRRYAEKSETLLDRKVSDLAPDRLMESLHGAFEKAFQVVFEKGNGLIRTVGRQEARRQTYETHADAVEQVEDRGTLRAFSKASGRAGAGNVLVSGVAGVGMGAFGVMLPDVPLMTAMLLKSVYETAESYGCRSDGEEERLYALRVMEAALSWGEELELLNRELDTYAQTGLWERQIPLREQIGRTARRLSETVLYGKALQNVPVVGAVGGAGDALCVSRVQRYADIKYHKRFLIRRRVTEF